jgi:hypothetical protein
MGVPETRSEKATSDIDPQQVAAQVNFILPFFPAIRKDSPR